MIIVDGLLGGELMSRIKDLKTEGGYCLLVELDNGSSVLLNLENRLQTARFGLLEDVAFFKTASTDGDFIRWGDQIEISVNEIFLLAQR